MKADASVCVSTSKSMSATSSLICLLKANESILKNSETSEQLVLSLQIPAVGSLTETGSLSLQVSVAVLFGGTISKISESVRSWATLLAHFLQVVTLQALSRTIPTFLF